jgi:homoserine O-acetyltransferase
MLTWYSLSPEWADKNHGRKWADPARDPGRDMTALYSVQAYLNGVGAARAKALDANSVIYTARASEIYSVDGKATVAEGLKAIKAKVLLLPSVNDQLLLPEKTREVRDLLRAQGNQVEYFELQGPMGHLNGVGGIAQAGEVIRAFLAR